MISHVDTFVFDSKLSVVYHHPKVLHSFVGVHNVLTCTFHSATHHDNTPITALVPQFACKVKVSELGEFLAQRTVRPLER